MLKGKPVGIISITGSDLKEGEWDLG